MKEDSRIHNLVIIQARIGSSRLPGKVLMNLANKTVLEHVVERVRRANYVDEVIVATTIKEEDIAIVKLCSNKGIRVFCGSENDVLDRYYQVAKLIKPLNVVRITADCPLIDPDIIDLVIREHVSKENDYTSNILGIETYPDGLDVEVIKFDVLKQTWKESYLLSHREHVTQYIIHNNSYKKSGVINSINYGNERWTLDTRDDYKLLENIYQGLYVKKQDFSFEDVLDYLKEHEELRKLNQGTLRNEGLRKSQINDFN